MALIITQAERQRRFDIVADAANSGEYTFGQNAYEKDGCFCIVGVAQLALVPDRKQQGIARLYEHCRVPTLPIQEVELHLGVLSLDRVTIVNDDPETTDYQPGLRTLACLMDVDYTKPPAASNAE